MDTIGVSLARRIDLAALLKLYEQLDREHAIVDGALGRRSNSERYRRLAAAIDDPRSYLALLRSGPLVEGFVLASFLRGEPDVVVEAIMISRVARRHGLGTRLFRSMEQWAHRGGVRFIELDVHEFNPEARAFYEELGYLTVRRRMRRAPRFILPLMGRGD